ncbi:Mu transposase C-terminal domain-containing protein [Campylobacter showae]|uniref:Mu transposase C-terminal domain-containing protein n=1 Tax=Campylobacter showae TaxID=204 RepID=UPI000F0798E1|nr:Mu transposase C-terminal domain-containing protein [Campylobacter showae]
MWVNSKQAAEILGVNNKSVEKAAFRATKSYKKFCTIKCHLCHFTYTDGIGRGGKTLQIWIDDDLINNKNSEISRADKASAVNLVNTAVRPLNFTNGESDGDIYADTKLDARDSVDIRGRNGGVFGGGLANTGARRDQEQTQINQNERVNDANRGNGRNQRSDASDSSYEQDDERGEAKAYSDAYAGDGIYECAHNEQRGLRLQSRSENQGVANGIALKDEAVECEVVESDGLNLSASSAANLPAIATCSDKKRKAAFEKYDVIKAWEDAKGKIGEAAFLEYINARKICCVKVTANKLYDWQRKYKRGGLDALVDERDNNKTLKLEELGLAQLCVELILACKGMGKVDITNIYKSLNYHAIKNSLINFEDFQGKKDEVVSYEVVNRFVNNYLNKNKLVKNIILYGEDGAVGRGLPALGISNYAVSTVNQVVEIDGSPLDLICNASELCDLIGWQNVSAIFKDKDEFESYVKEWQKRYTIIALIDTYSGVATFHISETENSLAIARAVAKYIVRYGKPRVIKGDNGKAFKSEYMREVLSALEIEYKAVKAYSGWLKPYVERNFRALQHSFSANLAGFIGHNISQRQAIEFFRSKKERRLKRGYKTNLMSLKNLNEVQELMDMYAEKFLNTRYLERLGTTCAAAYSQKVDDAVYMNAISISARLGKRELKHVHKKGVSVDNVWYYNLDMFAHERVFVNQNVNNINECFVWSENNEFIGVASTLDLELGVSAEEARTMQKLFNKRLKETKKQMDEASIAHQAGFEQTVRLVEAKPAALPKPQAVNNEAAIIDAALKEAKNLNSNAALNDEILSAAGSDVSPKRAKKIKGWMEIGCARA